jgi:flagellar hook protein FlgE
VDVDFTIQAASTIEDLLDFVTTQFGGASATGSTASLVNGEIRLADNEAGYSQTDLYTDYSGAGAFPLPQYYRMTSAGGNETRTTNVEIYDAQGVGHVATVAFIRKDDPALPNAWDVVLMSMMGDVRVEKRRVSDITFGTDGSFSGMGGASPDTPNFDVRYGNDLSNLHSLALNMGTVAQFDGLAQFGGPSTAAASTQDGYAAGWLSSLSVSREGVLEGMFTNGVRSKIAALKLATFQNPSGLQSIGSGYYAASGNSGDPMLAKALTAGAGSIRGASLEKSNVDVAAEFVNLIQAQNGYQANARTIRVANDMLKELANLIR